MKKLLFAALAAVMLAGCGSTQLARQNAAKPYGKFIQITDLKVDVSDQLKAQINDVTTFNKIAVAEQINQALDNQELRAEGKDRLKLKMAITLTGINVRGSAMAFMFGPLAGSDGLMGEVALIDQKGKEFDRFLITTSSSLGGIVAGGEAKRLDRLYSKFGYAAAYEITERMPAQD